MYAQFLITLGLIAIIALLVYKFLRPKLMAALEEEQNTEADTLTEIKTLRLRIEKAKLDNSISAEIDDLKHQLTEAEDQQIERKRKQIEKLRRDIDFKNFDIELDKQIKNLEKEVNELEANRLKNDE